MLGDSSMSVATEMQGGRPLCYGDYRMNVATERDKEGLCVMEILP